MSVKPIDLTGGKSVYCFNEQQMKQAFSLAEAQDESGEKIRTTHARLNEELTRNERAALAFVIIDELNRTAE